ncbi:multidrug ABC transporter ATP-binding protein [Pedobacter sp. HMWF019]|uniref:ABC transporter ATP-binding protein n=1 Tax=Pedobacter sp. HMWF019 TaxID=2056856 RepID=UPI000D33C2A6|nr:ABC transporter ATP-binding protein [Pedobacter sp. HMWF019]PTS96778.1 multidrug ABC transporter ATP-binding protein [Pedobacter sp. HMWF019]
MNEPIKSGEKLNLAGLPGRRGNIVIERPKNSRQAILRLWNYLKRQKWLLILALFLLLVNIASTLAGSYLLRPVVNHYILPHNLPGLIRMVFVLIGIYIIGAAAGILVNRLMVVVGQNTVRTIRAELFGKIQALPLRFFDANSHGELMSRFTNDMDNVSDCLNTSVLQLFTSGITLAGIFVLMLLISPVLTLVTLIIVPLMLWVVSAIIKRSKDFFTTQQIALGKVNGYVEEMITGQKVVKVFCYEDSSRKAFDEINDDLREKATSAQLYSGVMQPLVQNLNTINFALTATVGGFLAILRGFDLGGLAAFLLYSRQFGRPVNELSSEYNSLQAALAGAERIFQILDEIPEPADIKEAQILGRIEGNVQLKNVTFSYDQGKVILKNITLEAKPGQKIALVGSTGAGKTTIMNLLPRFYDIDSGQITIDGTDIKNIQRNSLRRSMAIVLQDTHLFTATVMENIRYGRLEATDEEVITAATLAGADSFIRRLPKGYQTKLENDGGNLSQGQRQLLNITRATVARPSILILDEATSSIDTRTEQIIQQGMDQLMKGRTSFVIAHRLSTVRNADEILVLEQGEIIERGNHEELLKQKGRYYQLYNGQFD